MLWKQWLVHYYFFSKTLDMFWFQHFYWCIFPRVCSDTFYDAVPNMETLCSFLSPFSGREWNICVCAYMWYVCVYACAHAEGSGKVVEFKISFARDELCSPGILRTSLTSDCLIVQINGFLNRPLLKKLSLCYLFFLKTLNIFGLKLYSPYKIAFHTYEIKSTFSMIFLHNSVDYFHL